VAQILIDSPIFQFSDFGFSNFFSSHSSLKGGHANLKTFLHVTLGISVSTVASPFSKLLPDSEMLELPARLTTRAIKIITPTLTAKMIQTRRVMKTV
jgi:hypothetical protein